jgi:membrane protein DedA with SNARE-associated domain
MIDLNLSDLFIAGIISYGPAALGLMLLLGALGIPIPGTLLVVAAGSLAQQGKIDWSMALGLGLLGAASGDTMSYALGRFTKGLIQRRFELSMAWQTARDYFEQRGALAIYLTRFLFTPLAIPTNLIAGSSRVTFWRFLTYDVAGELTWLMLYGGLGYIFGSRWELIVEVIGNYSYPLSGVAAVGIGFYFLIRYLRSSANGFRPNYCFA